MNYKLSMKILAVMLISLLFLYSGFDKILNFNETVVGLNNKLGLFTYDTSQIFIIGAILVLIISPILMNIGILVGNNLLLRIGTWFLILFVILATLIYHRITDAAQINDILKNLAIIGGLVLISVQASELD